MKGINAIKHRNLFAVSLKIQGGVDQSIDAAAPLALRNEMAELNELYRQYLELLQQLKGIVQEYESKERTIRSKILSPSLRKLAKNGQTGADLRMVINSLNSCAH
ncbi:MULTISPECIES: hypothetical protein [Sphingobacterium]|jgi:hypothetical protein|uniref:hypothetical protein n=1 Tax=Sphingobacterium TaxID=28453 RepID=UPI000966768D|nr:MULTISPECIES: hypothetical protein [Sphingobacterium]OJZ09744.1 MAG: hypothetical protein BGP15_03520 [Sphingobacterium sp. 40-24]